MATYSVEPAKSGRASCKKCKSKIEKDDLRVGTHRVSADDIMMVTWNHATCFTLPRKLLAEEFFTNLQVHEDVTEAQLTQLKELLDDPDGNTPGGKRSSGASEGGSNKKAKADITKGMNDSELALYEKYRSFTLEGLKDFMRWNKQPIAGTKPELIIRCIDGELHGAIPSCPEPGCKGKLRLDNGKVSCGGAYNEELGSFLRCYYSAQASSITRLPWKESKPTEEEVLEGTTFSASVNQDAAKDLFAGLDLTTLTDRREAVHRFLAVVRSEGINVGSDDNEAKIKIGTLMMSNNTLGPEELLCLAESKYGTVKSSKAKLKMASTGTVCEGNEGIVLALTKLSQAYFKSGNANAGNTYRKASSAVRSCPELILSGKRVSKGKDKLDGIGAKCGEYIDEFLATGTIAKIAEKM
mmetsp:Transcript_15082/g.24994  ORF Transcript_15082/g.24994 Transcript_15082/m.24994 type:complete len:411 (+) Transcript_15082:65-1297(+)